MKRFPSGAVIVTGAAQGIGRRPALTLVGEGVDVCVADWNDEKGKAVAVEGRQELAAAFSLKQMSQMKRVARQRLKLRSPRSAPCSA